MAHRIATVGEPGSAVALSLGGRLLAFTSSPDPCNLKVGDDRAVVQDLATGRRHTIEVRGGLGEGSSRLAWSPEGGTLAIVARVGLADSDRIHLVHDPFHVRTTKSAAPGALPYTQTCDQMAPSYSAAGRLLYLARIGSPSCWFSTCPAMSYDVIRYDATLSAVLALRRAVTLVLGRRQH